jgi:hypothetical protein
LRSFALLVLLDSLRLFNRRFLLVYTMLLAVVVLSPGLRGSIGWGALRYMVEVLPALQAVIFSTQVLVDAKGGFLEYYLSVAPAWHYVLVRSLSSMLTAETIHLAWLLPLSLSLLSEPWAVVKPLLLGFLLAFSYALLTVTLTLVSGRASLTMPTVVSVFMVTVGLLPYLPRATLDLLLLVASVTITALCLPVSFLVRAERLLRPD